MSIFFLIDSGLLALTMGVEEEGVWNHSTIEPNQVAPNNVPKNESWPQAEPKQRWRIQTVSALWETLWSRVGRRGSRRLFTEFKLVSKKSRSPHNFLMLDGYFADYQFALPGCSCAKEKKRGWRLWQQLNLASSSNLESLWLSRPLVYKRYSFMSNWFQMRPSGGVTWQNGTLMNEIC